MLLGEKLEDAGRRVKPSFCKENISKMIWLIKRNRLSDVLNDNKRINESIVA